MKDVCVLPHKDVKYESNFNLLNLTELDSLSSYPSNSNDQLPSSNCFFISTRNWQADFVGSSGEGALYQENCDFQKGFEVEEPTQQKSLNDCINHCFNVTKCTHFTYQIKICGVRKAQVFTDRLAVENNRMCGYIPSRLNKTSEEDSIHHSSNLLVYAVAAVVIAVIVLLATTGFALGTYFVTLNHFIYVK